MCVCVSLCVCVCVGRFTHFLSISHFTVWIDDWFVPLLSEHFTFLVRVFFFFVSVCMRVRLFANVGVAKAPCPQGKGSSSKQLAGSQAPGGKHWFLIRLIIWPVMGLCFFFCATLQKPMKASNAKSQFCRKFPEEKLWKIKVAGLTTWEHTFFPPVADRCTWIDQICEIWGLLSFWRGENLSKSTDWAASHS